MMAGTGVSAGGAGMLRTRRRDVSVKPNRKLDRKSSRGMIYENEELRLRTIHINAEVEQGQNDIKKLRRENEQLRREIWSLRDEYDKLEEILKRQKNQDESEEYEDRSEEEDEDVQSDYSCEEEEEEREPAAKESLPDEEPAEDCSTKEQLENVENDKISSEKMSNSLHRLHVDFDDLSVVDEEEELKREKERKDVTSPDGQGRKPAAVRPRQLHDNIPFYPAGYAPSSAFDAATYYAGCPFDFPNTMDLMLPSEASTLRADPLGPVSTLDSQLAEPILPQLHVPPPGWRAETLLPGEQSSYPTIATASQAFQDQQAFASSRRPGLLERRKPSPNLKDSFKELALQYPSENGWLSVDAGSGGKIADYGESRSKKSGNASMEGMFTFDGSEKPKHFFAPLPSKVRRQTDEGSPTPSSSQFGTGTSSSSGRTGSTVVSKSPFTGGKGCADIYVNGAVPYEEGEQKGFLSSDNLVMGDNRSTANQLIKSISCQDLTESLSGTCGQLRAQLGEKPQMLTQSDNTLDSTANETSKPYKSHLNVTLKAPRSNQLVAPNPPTPNLASINYRLFNNPFLKTFDPTRQQFASEDSPVTRPLSIQVNDDNSYYNYPAPPSMSSFSRRAHTVDRHASRGQSDRNRLLIPSTQLFPSKTMSHRSKPELEITSFERPSPHTLVSPGPGYDLGKLRRINASPYMQNRGLYQNVPMLQDSSGSPAFYGSSGPMRLYYEQAAKVSTQTQTSIDGDSHRDDEQIHSHPEEESRPSSPSVQRARKARREKEPTAPSAISPGGHRRLKKQGSVTSSETIDSASKVARKRPRKLSVGTTTTASEGGAQEDKNESRSSSSGQDSPRKEQTRRVSLYFNAKKRPSLASLKTTRSASVDTTKDKYLDGSEREPTNSISSRETSVKARKASTSSGSVPWCACWGNGCI